MNFSASIDCDRPCLPRWPCGAVSPMRTVSVPWPVSASACQAVRTSSRYSDGAASTCFLALRGSGLHCGVSQPAWLGSFQIDQ